MESYYIHVVDEVVHLVHSNVQLGSGNLNPFGQITHGSVDLRGRHKQANLQRHETVTRGIYETLNSVKGAAAVDPKSQPIFGEVRLDLRLVDSMDDDTLRDTTEISSGTQGLYQPCTRVSIGSTVWSILCLARDKCGKWQLICLVQALKNQERTYRRIGLRFVNEIQWFGGLGASPKSMTSSYLTTVRID